MTRRQDVVDLAMQRMSAPEIAKQLGISRQSVYVYLNRARKKGADIPEPNRKKQRILIITQMAQEGKSVAEIAKSLAVTKQYVRCTISQARKKGHVIPYQNVRRSKYPEHIQSKISSDQKDVLRIEAARRKISVSELVREILSAILRDNLIDAVLDD